MCWYVRCRVSMGERLAVLACRDRGREWWRTCSGSTRGCGSMCTSMCFGWMVCMGGILARASRSCRAEGSDGWRRAAAGDADPRSGSAAAVQGRAALGERAGQLDGRVGRDGMVRRPREGRGGESVCPVGGKWAANVRRRGWVIGWTRARGCGRLARMGSQWSGTAACSSYTSCNRPCSSPDSERRCGRSAVRAGSR